MIVIRLSKKFMKNQSSMVLTAKNRHCHGWKKLLLSRMIILMLLGDQLNSTKSQNPTSTGVKAGDNADNLWCNKSFLVPRNTGICINFIDRGALFWVVSVDLCVVSATHKLAPSLLEFFQDGWSSNIWFSILFSYWNLIQLEETQVNWEQVYGLRRQHINRLILLRRVHRY